MGYVIEPPLFPAREGPPSGKHLGVVKRRSVEKERRKIRQGYTHIQKRIVHSSAIDVVPARTKAAQSKEGEGDSGRDRRVEHVVWIANV